MSMRENLEREFEKRWREEEESVAKPKPNGKTEEAPAAEAWPVIEDAAFYGMLGEAVRRIEPETEADPIAVLAHLITFYGNAAGRKAHCQIGADWHTTNLFVALVGKTSSRKGTAASRARQVLSILDDEWELTRIKNGLSSGEGLIHHVRDPVTIEVVDK